METTLDPKTAVELKMKASATDNPLSHQGAMVICCGSPLSSAKIPLTATYYHVYLNSGADLQLVK